MKMLDLSAVLEAIGQALILIAHILKQFSL
jgi:hypothetical protein